MEQAPSAGIDGSPWECKRTSQGQAASEIAAAVRDALAWQCVILGYGMQHPCALRCQSLEGVEFDGAAEIRAARDGYLGHASHLAFTAASTLAAVDIPMAGTPISTAHRSVSLEV